MTPMSLTVHNCLIRLHKNTRAQVAPKILIFSMIPNNKCLRGGAINSYFKGFFETLAPNLHTILPNWPNIAHPKTLIGADQNFTSV